MTWKWSWGLWGSTLTWQLLRESPRTAQLSLWTWSRLLEGPWDSSLGSPLSARWKLSTSEFRSSRESWESLLTFRDKECYVFLLWEREFKSLCKNLSHPWYLNPWVNYLADMMRRRSQLVASKYGALSIWQPPKYINAQGIRYQILLLINISAHLIFVLSI